MRDELANELRRRKIDCYSHAISRYGLFDGNDNGEQIQDQRQLPIFGDR